MQYTKPDPFHIAFHIAAVGHHGDVGTALWRNGGHATDLRDNGFGIGFSELRNSVATAADALAGAASHPYLDRAPGTTRN